MRLELITNQTFNTVTGIGDSARSEANPTDEAGCVEQGLESCESSFLLDWLVGGKACARNIQEFSFEI
jgi:hypothetical protein